MPVSPLPPGACPPRPIPPEVAAEAIASAPRLRSTSKEALLRRLSAPIFPDPDAPSPAPLLPAHDFERSTRGPTFLVPLCRLLYLTSGNAIRDTRASTTLRVFDLTSNGSRMVNVPVSLQPVELVVMVAVLDFYRLFTNSLLHTSVTPDAIHFSGAGSRTGPTQTDVCSLSTIL
uniref:Uncharacterized protein n=1 Tax=Anopheles coluzzii TaxID=1518534 RepID=A0A8W7P1E3_ANOCL